MQDLAVQAAGVLAILVALTHGALGELKVFTTAQIEPPRTRRLLRLIWRTGTVDWIGMGVLLVASPSFGSQIARHWIVAVAVVVYACAAAANAFAPKVLLNMPTPLSLHQ